MGLLFLSPCSMSRESVEGRIVTVTASGNKHATFRTQRACRQKANVTATKAALCANQATTVSCRARS